METIGDTTTGITIGTAQIGAGDGIPGMAQVGDWDGTHGMGLTGVGDGTVIIRTMDMVGIITMATGTAAIMETIMPILTEDGAPTTAPAITTQPGMTEEGLTHNIQQAEEGIQPSLERDRQVHVLTLQRQDPVQPAHAFTKLATTA